MLKDGNLVDVQTNGMKYGSVALDEEKISGVHINKLWAYSYRNLASKTKQPGKPNNPEKKCQCCEMKFTIGHMKQYKVINVKCSNCKKVGCFAKACQ